MLVLSRRHQEEIVIGDDIVITVVKISDDKVRIGVEAPREVPVNRREIHDRIRQRLELADPDDSVYRPETLEEEQEAE